MFLTRGTGLELDDLYCPFQFKRFCNSLSFIEAEKLQSRSQIERWAGTVSVCTSHQHMGNLHSTVSRLKGGGWQNLFSWQLYCCKQFRWELEEGPAGGRKMLHLCIRLSFMVQIKNFKFALIQTFRQWKKLLQRSHSSDSSEELGGGCVEWMPVDSFGISFGKETCSDLQEPAQVSS